MNEWNRRKHLKKIYANLFYRFLHFSFLENADRYKKASISNCPFTSVVPFEGFSSPSDYLNDYDGKVLLLLHLGVGVRVCGNSIFSRATTTPNEIDSLLLLNREIAIKSVMTKSMRWSSRRASTAEEINVSR
jgi:hypothetical protein